MLKRIKILASLYRELGLRWSAFRLAYAFRHRSGLIRLQMPQYKWADRPLATWLKKNIPSESTAYAEWRKANAPKFFDNVGVGSPRPMYSENAIAEADRILNGEIKYFSHDFHKTGFPPNWYKDPVSGVELDSKKHWSNYSDDGDSEHVAARRSWFLPKQSPRTWRLLRREEQKPSSQRHI